MDGTAVTSVWEDELTEKIRASAAQCKIEYADGSSEIIATGPIGKPPGAPREPDFLMGEIYDARLENRWDQARGLRSRWAPVDIGAEVDPLIQAYPGPPVRAFATLEPKGIDRAAAREFMSLTWAGILPASRA